MEQCVVKKGFTPSFVNGKEPELTFLYKIKAEKSDCVRAMHAHANELEIVLINSGQGVYSIDGKRRAVKEGGIIIYNSNVVHEETFGIDGQINSYCCGISNLHLTGLRPNALIADDIPPVFASGVQYQNIATLLELIFTQLANRVPRASETCHYLMLSLISILLDLTQSYVEREDRTGLKNNILGRRIKSYIDEHYTEDLTLDSIAKAIHVSVYYMSHTFKEETGYSPLQYVSRRRIGEAQSLLVQTDYSATRIGAMVGFGNPSYFNAIFTKNVGMPPLRYRRTCVALNKEK